MSHLSNELYELTADVTTGGLLNSTLLANDGVGIALTNTSGIVASSTNLANMLNVTLLTGNTYTISRPDLRLPPGISESSFSTRPVIC